MTHILILFYSMVGFESANAAMTTAEFKDWKSCEHAGIQATQKLNRDIKWICVPVEV